MMAKNTGKVGTVDIVKHDGGIYVKEERKAEVGEKVTVTARHNGHQFKIGEIVNVYEVCVKGTKGEHIGAEVNDNKWWLIHTEYNVLVPLKPGAKVTVEGVDGPQAYEVSDRKAQVGDKVITFKDDEYEDFSAGDIFEVENGFGIFEDDIIFYDNDGDERVDAIEEDTYTLIPVAKSNENQTKEGDDMSEVITYEGVKYRKVERKAKKGEKVIILSAKATGGKYENGDILTVSYIGGLGLPVANDRSLFHREYNVLEPVEDATPDKSIDEQIAELERQLAEHRERKAKQEAEAQRLQEANRLRVGEYAVVLAEDEPFVKGEVVKVTCDDFSALPYKAEKLDSDNYVWFYPEELRRATPEEVASASAEAKAKLAVEAECKAVEEKWAKIGRKVGEFKAGDLVKTKFHGIIEITEIREGDCHPIRFVNGSGKDDGFSLKADLELIVPVEQRFDK